MRLESYRIISRAIQQKHAIYCRPLREENKPEVVSPKISQDSLAEMIGVTFRKEFRKPASSDCNCGLHRRSLLTIVLHDSVSRHDRCLRPAKVPSCLEKKLFRPEQF